MRYIKFKTYSDAAVLNNRVTAECLRASVWNDGTNNYCNPNEDTNGMWQVPILDGYEMFFTTGEIDRSWNDDDLVPREVQLWRVRTILKTLGMEQVVEVALNSLPEPTKTAALYIWNYGTTVERNSQTVLLLQSVLGLTDAQTDDIFIQAENIII